MRVSFWIAVLVAIGASAQAQEQELLARARRCFDAGSALYDLGKYDEAIEQFTEGYDIAPRPQFLLNIGQAYRKLRNWEKARELYQKYLAAIPERDPTRDEVKRVLSEIERERSSVAPIATAAPAKSVVPIAPTPSPPSVSAEQQAPPPHRSGFFRRNLWIWPVAALLIGGAAVGVYFAARPPGPSCDQATIGCYDPTAMH